jgi:hypothetical protein
MRFIISVLVAAASIVAVAIFLIAGMVPDSPLECRQVTRLSDGSFLLKGLATIGGITTGNARIMPDTLNSHGVSLYGEILKACPHI